MIPGPSVFALLALGVYRACRLIGWDDFPPIVRARDWATGAHEETFYVCPTCAVEREDYDPSGWVGRNDCPACGSAQAPQAESEPGFRRPLLAEFLACPYCLGAWASLIVYLCWISAPRFTLYATVPFALSATVGLIAKNWDA